MRRIAGFARPYRAWLIIFLVLIIFDALVSAAGPLVYKAIIDEGIIKGRSAYVVAMAGLVALLAIVSAVNGITQRWYSARIGEGLVFDLRTQVFDHVQTMPIGFFTRARPGALVTRLNSDVQGAQQAFTSTLSNVVGNIVGVTATLVAMLRASASATSLVAAPAALPTAVASVRASLAMESRVFELQPVLRRAAARTTP